MGKAQLFRVTSKQSIISHTTSLQQPKKQKVKNRRNKKNKYKKPPTRNTQDEVGQHHVYLNLNIIRIKSRNLFLHIFKL